MVMNPARVGDYGKDGELIVWIVNQARDNLYGLSSGGAAALFDANIYYPYRNVLAYSEMFFLSAFMWSVWGNLVSDPLAVSGFLVVSGQLLTMMVLYSWWDEISENGWAASIMAVAFGLSQLRFHYQVHLQLWGMQFWLLGTWLVTRWLKGKGRAWQVACGVVLIAFQAWESILPVFFSMTIILVHLIIFKPKIRYKYWMTSLLFFGVIVSLPVMTYLRVSREFQYTRSIRDAAHFSLGADELVTYFLSPGLYLLIIAAFLRHNKEMGKEERWLLVVGATAVILALGPVLKWSGNTVKLGGKIPVPLPYTVAYYTVPGFGAFRTPSRWMWLAGWALAGWATMGLARTPALSDKGKRKVWVWAGLTAVAIGGGTWLYKYRDLESLSEMPEVYRKLEQLPGEVVVELPMGGEGWETGRMLYSLRHKKTLVNGFSGFGPPMTEQLGIRLNKSFPTIEAMEELKMLGVQYVVVHRESNEKMWQAVGQWNNEFEQKGAGHLLWEDEKTWLIEL